MDPRLEPAARYFPVRKTYDVSPSLRPLGTDFGNGDADARVFQLDQRFPRFRESKLACRAERLGKYCLEHQYTPAVAQTVNRFITRRLVEEHPAFFRIEEADGVLRLHCALTDEVLAFSEQGEWLPDRSRAAVSPGYVSGLDALACQVVEDLAVTLTEPGSEDWLAAAHVCSPSHWSAAEKMGEPFVRIHAPVPGMERIMAAAPSLVRATVQSGPFVRFVWGVSGTDRPNRHPEPPPGSDSAEWRPRAFDLNREPPFWFVTERQVLWGLPEVGAALFVIGPAFQDPRLIRENPDEREALISALRSMSPETLAYKGLTEDAEALIGWLEES